MIINIRNDATATKILVELALLNSVHKNSWKGGVRTSYRKFERGVVAMMAWKGTAAGFLLLGTLAILRPGESRAAYPRGVVMLKWCVHFGINFFSDYLRKHKTIIRNEVVQVDKFLLIEDRNMYPTASLTGLLMAMATQRYWHISPGIVWFQYQLEVKFSLLMCEQVRFVY